MVTSKLRTLKDLKCLLVLIVRNVVAFENFESEKIYNTKMDEFTNITISEAATYEIDNNQLLMTLDEKESIKETLLMKFTKS